jgi:hypothetical protein
VPKLKGTVISAKPPVKSKELVVGVENAAVPEVTLRFETALAGKPKVGSVIEFEGVPTAFSKDPFMLTFESEKDKISGTRDGSGRAGGEKRPPAGRSPARRSRTDLLVCPGVCTFWTGQRTAPGLVHFPSRLGQGDRGRASARGASAPPDRQEAFPTASASG